MSTPIQDNTEGLQRILYTVNNLPSVAVGDWDASEGELGHVKNRTHYKEVNSRYVEYFPEQAITTATNSSGKNLFTVNLGLSHTSHNLIEETKYKVIFDGIEYEVFPTGTGATKNALGNLSVSDASAEDTGEPFRINISSNGTKAIVFTPEPGEHTFVIYELETTTVYHKIPAEYLPDPIQLVIVDAEGVTRTFKLWGEEIVSG